jgi:hypothetical protein
MMRATVMYAVLLLALLAGAWAQWTSEPEIDHGDKVVLLPGSSDDITEIRWKGEKSESTVTRRSDDRGTYFWVDHTRWTKKKAPKKDPAEATEDPLEETPPEEPERVAKKSEFKAGPKVDELTTNLSPMLALRRLEVTDADKLEEIGLSAPSATLDVVRGARTQTLEVGGEAYGSRHVYVRRVSDGQIYLVERDLLQTIKYARSRLADHSLFSLKRKKVAAATIQTAQGTVSTTQKNAADKDKARWVRTGAPDEVAEQLTTWMGKALKLKGMRYAGPDDLPEDLQERFQLTLDNGSGTAETLVVSQVGEDGDWYGRSEHTRGLVKLVRSASKSLFDDVGSLFGE